MDPVEGKHKESGRAREEPQRAGFSSVMSSRGYSLSFVSMGVPKRARENTAKRIDIRGDPWKNGDDSAVVYICLPITVKSREIHYFRGDEYPCKS